MATSKTPSKAVRTTNRLYTFYLEKLTFRGSSYYMTKAEWFQLLNFHFRDNGSTQSPTVYTQQNTKTTYNVEQNGDTRYDFFAIGCMKFSRNSLIKIAKWCGFNTTYIG